MTSAVSSSLRGRLAVFSVASMLVTSACTDREPPLGPGCFPQDPWEDAINEAYEYLHSDDFLLPELAKMRMQIGFCEYPSNNLGYDQHQAAFPDEDYSHHGLAVYCEDVPESGDCEQCPEEDMDAVLREQYQDAQDANPECWDGSSRQIMDYERGCVGKYLTDDGEKCCYSAVVYAPCP